MKLNVSYSLTKRFLAAATTAMVIAVVAACTPPPTAPPAPLSPPKVVSFGLATEPNSSPALVTFRWNVTDANKDDLTCRIIVSGAPAPLPEIVIPSCQGVGSHNLSLGEGQYRATLTVDDGVVVDGVVGSDSMLTMFNVYSGPTEPFNITLVGLDDLDPVSRATFASAAAKWEQAITTGLPDVGTSGFGCQAPDGSDLPPVIDDVLIYAKVAPIDGVGSILGQAGPSCIMMSSELTVIGEMTFDSADVANMQTNGSFQPVILHEMGHVLGIGTLWDTSWSTTGTRRLLTGAGTANPRFVGAAASAEWQVLNNGSDRGGVPVENTGGQGTVDSHWRESVFTSELMTGWANVPAPMSAMTIASLADLGYHVDLSAAEPFSLNGAPAVRSAEGPLAATTILRPTIEVATGTPGTSGPNS